MAELIGRYSNNYAHLLPVTKLVRLLTVEKRPTDRDRSPVVPVHKLTQRLTADEHDELVTAYEAGATPAELARRYEISHAAVPRLLKQLGVTMRKRGLSDDELAEAIRLYESGLSLARIGAKLAKDPTTVRNYLIRAGVRTRDSHGSPEITAISLARSVSTHAPRYRRPRSPRRSPPQFR